MELFHYCCNWLLFAIDNQEDLKIAEKRLLTIGS